MGGVPLIAAADTSPEMTDMTVLIEYLGRGAINPMYAHVVATLPVPEAINAVEQALSMIELHKEFCIVRPRNFDKLPEYRANVTEATANVTEPTICYSNELLNTTLAPKFLRLSKEVAAVKLEGQILKSNGTDRDKRGANFGFHLDVNKGIDQVTGFFARVFHVPSLQKLQANEVVLAQNINKTMRFARKINDLQVKLTDRVNENSLLITSFNEELSEMEREVAKVKVAQVCDIMLDSGLDLMDLTHQSISDIARGQVPATLFDVSEARDTISLVNEYALDNGYEMLTESPLDFYNIKASVFVTSDNRWVLVPHIPLIPVKTSISLYRYHSLPIVKEKKGIVPKVPDRFVFGATVDLQDRIKHVSLDIGSCYPLADAYVCERVPIWVGVTSRKNPHSACMAALLNNLPNICEFETYQQDTWGPVAVGTKLYYYADAPERVKVTNSTHVAAEELKVGRNVLSLQPGLKIESKSWIFKASEVADLDFHVKWFNVSKIVDLATVTDYSAGYADKKQIYDLKKDLRSWQKESRNLTEEIEKEYEALEAAMKEFEAKVKDLETEFEADNYEDTISFSILGSLALMVFILLFGCWCLRCIKKVTLGSP